jgi:CheY-like chemotaxis protein
MQTTGIKTVLIVDDDKDIRNILTEKLTTEGFNVVEAENGQVALEKYYQASKIDIILLDINMPVMDGHVFLKNLRLTPKGKNVPVLVLSNMAGHEDIVEAFDEHITDYLLKPNINLNAVVEKITKVIDNIESHNV